MEIMVPNQKPRLPHPTGIINTVRTLGIIGWVGYVLLFSMIFSEGKVSFPHLQRTVELIALSFCGFLLTWKFQRLGGIVLVAGMVAGLVLTPIQLSEWRPWLFGLEAFMALVGTLFVLVPRKKT